MDIKTGRFSGYAKSSMSEKEYHITISGTRTASAIIKITILMPEQPVIIPSVDDKIDDEGVVIVSYSAGLINIVLFDAIGDNLQYSVNPRIIYLFINIYL